MGSLMLKKIQKKKVINLEFFQHVARPYPIEPELLYAFAMVESSLDPNTCRFEPAWSYHYNVSKYAKKCQITRDTEKVLQSISWGLMQVMGTVAREHGFERHLTELTSPYLNLDIAIQKIMELQAKYEDIADVISSYNQGFPRKMGDGKYRNQAYVDKVLAVYQRISK